jgi:hypothetical protein
LIELWVSGSGAPHLWVVGGTGAGKTSFIKNLAIMLLARGIPLTIIDYDGEYIHLPLIVQEPPFPVNVDQETLAWLLSQAARPEEGGYAIELHLQRRFLQFNNENIEEIINIEKEASYNGLPANIRQAIMWRLHLFRKYFTLSPTAPDGIGVIYDLSPIRGGRAKEVVQQILLTYLVQVTTKKLEFFIFEEASHGPFLRDILLMSRKKGARIIAVSQTLPDSEFLSNFEFILFTPYINQRLPLPLPVDPATDRGVWWVGRLGIHRLNLHLPR